MPAEPSSGPRPVAETPIMLELGDLYDLARDLASTIRLEDLVPIALSWIHRLLDCPVAGLLLPKPPHLGARSIFYVGTDEGVEDAVVERVRDEAIRCAGIFWDHDVGPDDIHRMGWHEKIVEPGDRWSGDRDRRRRRSRTEPGLVGGPGEEPSSALGPSWKQSLCIAPLEAPSDSAAEGRSGASGSAPGPGGSAGVAADDSRAPVSAALPAAVADLVLGLFVALPRTRAFSRAEIHVFSNVTNQASLALSNAILFERTRRLATTDGLTGLLNHRTFQETLRRETARALRYRLPLSVVMVDLDNLKPVNDQHGHRVGDRVLLGVARILARSVRDNVDHVARYGGDEFALILPETDQAGALVVAERMRAAVEATVLDPSGQRVRVTASFGVAALADTSTLTEAELLEWADRCLYQAKESGRNRVVAAEPPIAKAG